MGQSPPSTSYNEYGEGLPFFQGKAEFTSLFPEVRKWCTTPTKVANAKDILLSVRAPVGPTNLAPSQCCIGRGLAAIRPEGDIQIRFVLYAVRALNSRLVEMATGTTFGAISGDDVRAFGIPLAPLAEQRRIVAAIEQQFSRLDAAIASLNHARKKLKRERAAILKAAIEGKLTELWRAEHPADETASQLLQRILVERRAKWEADQLAKMQAKGVMPKDEKWKQAYREPEPPDTTGLPELPEGWVWATVDQLGEVQLGRQRAPKYHTGPNMRPYLRVANVFEDCIDTTDVMTMNFTPEEYEIYRLEYGDILLNEGQSLELVGRPAMYRDEVPGACFQNTLVRFRVCDGLLAQFALAVFRVYLHRRRFQHIGRHTTNIAHLGAGRFAALVFPLPPFSEQQQIVSEVERRLSIIARTEAEVEANLKRAARLRQAILSEAFAGRLVPQDPQDEPASVLLERIREERWEREERRKGKGRNGNGNGRYVEVEASSEPVSMDVEGVEQGALW
jgi:type I restriction enzyme, S subunit